MDRPKSDIDIRLMSLTYRFRDFFTPRRIILDEVGIKPGFHVLDYGCGPRSYILPLVELIGETGKVYALDIHPLAIKVVQNIAAGRKLNNVTTILSDCKTGLPDNSIDTILFYDTLHVLSNTDRVLTELHRILKPDGCLSFSDHHMEENEIMSKITGGGLFKLSVKSRKTFIFVKV